jgi:hypothetical protein
MPAPALRPQGDSQQKGERRNGNQATHTTRIIAPFRTFVRFSRQLPGVAPSLARALCGTGWGF